MSADAARPSGQLEVCVYWRRNDASIRYWAETMVSEKNRTIACIMKYVLCNLLSQTLQGQIDGAHRFDAASLRVLIESKAPSVLAEYEKSGTFSVTSRKLLVKIGVSDLVERRGL